MVGNLHQRRLGLRMCSDPCVDGGFFACGIACELDLGTPRNRRALIFPLAAFGRRKAGNKGHHHHTAILRQTFQHRIRHVSGMRCNSARVAVREQHRSFALVEHIMHCGFGHMAEVDNHPQTVHLGNYFKAKGRQTVMFGRVRCAIGPIGRQAVGDRHIACAKGMHLA